MGYAIKKDDSGWRSVPSSGDVKVDEVYSETQPAFSQNSIKSQMWGLIKAERDRRQRDCGYQVGNKWFHSDDSSRIQQLGLTMMGSSIPSGLQWKTMDGSFVIMTQTLASQIFQAATVSDMAIFTAAETHKTNMQASSDPASYNFLTGWPKGYGE